MATVFTVDIIGEFVDALRALEAITNITNTVGDTYLIETPNTYTLRNTQFIVIDDISYQVSELIQDTSFEITSTTVITGTQWKAEAPYYQHGTPQVINTETKAKKSYRRYPLICLFEILREGKNRDPNTLMIKQPELVMFFMDDAKYAKWSNADHHDNAVQPMEILEDAFVDLLEANPYIGKLWTTYTSILRSSWGTFTPSKGNVKQIFDDPLSGVELRINPPFLDGIGGCNDGELVACKSICELIDITDPAITADCIENSSNGDAIKAIVCTGGVVMTADFVADVTDPEASEIVTFTDLTDEIPTHWSWRFGDGDTSILQNPTHAYSIPGTYTVELLAGNTENAGDVEVKTDYITVTSFSPIQLNPFVWYHTIDKATGAQPAFPDETGSYTAIGGVSFVDIGGESFADFRAGACYDADSGFAPHISGAHTVVMVVDVDADIPSAFEALIGAWTNAAGGQHQYTVFQITVTGKIRHFIKLAANDGIADTLTQGLSSGVKSVVTFRIDQTNGIRIRINGVNRLLDGTNNGSLSSLTLSNLDVNINQHWGCRNANGVDSSFHNGNHGGLIGYNYLLTDAQCEQIEDFYG